MYLCFVDESGHVPSKARAEKVGNFVIAGLMVPEAQWTGVASDFANAKSRFKVTGEIKWRYFGPQNNEPNNSVAHLEPPERTKCRNALLASITKRKSCRIVATRAKLKEAWELPYIHTKRDIYHYTYKQTLERINYFLQDVSKLTGDTHRGMVICDHRGADDDKVFREYHATMTEKESAYTSNFRNFVERVMLTDSQHSVGIQLVDLCAGAIGHAYNYDKMDWIETLRQNIRAHPQKGIDGYGIVHWPK